PLFDEDACRLSVGHAAQAIAILNNLILGLLRFHGFSAIASARRLFNAFPTHALHSFISRLTLHRRLALWTAFPQKRKSKDFLRTCPGFLPLTIMSVVVDSDSISPEGVSCQLNKNEWRIVSAKS